MTVAEIQEYIDNSIQESEQVGMSGYDSALYLKNSMRTVRSMLDDLDRPNEVKLMCPRCKHEWQKPITEFCGKCGETMEVIEIYYTKGENRSEL